MPRVPSVLRDTDAEAVNLARHLVREALFGSLAVLDPDDGHPHASRVGIGLDIDGVPVVLVSGLSLHTRALENDPRCSLLVGRTGKGDALAHPRLTLRCRAEPVGRPSANHERLRARFLRRHPKSAIYADLPDFRFFRLVASAASLNGGFGRAYVIAAESLAILSPARFEIAEREDEILAELNGAETHQITRLATLQIRGRAKAWLAVGIDAAGMDLAASGHFLRVEFNRELSKRQDLGAALVELYG